LAGAGPDDPRVAPLAAELVAAVPDGVLAVIPDGEPSPTGFGRVLLDDYPPAQREVVRRVMAALAERVRTRAGGGTP
ncbi:MerR family transcriptional regulator, partial [Streptomyces griseus]|nr:MerR family transcriptional regulator [Streptomyces griseus]